MVFSALDLILVVAIITNGLLTGLFFVFTCAISRAFRRVDDAIYVSAFRAINTAILNGCFLSVFFAAPLSAIASAVIPLWRGDSAPTPLLIAGAICSILAFGVTVAANVPLNRELDQSLINTEQQRQVARRRFEARWNQWNLARTLASIGAFAFLTAAVTE